MLTVGGFLFIVLLFFLVGFILLMKLFLYVLKRLLGKEAVFATKRVKKGVLGMGIIAAVGIIFVLFTQLTAATPKITKENSIAELREVRLNGRKE